MKPKLDFGTRIGIFDGDLKKTNLEFKVNQ
jgi:hypothetical protein